MALGIGIGAVGGVRGDWSTGLERQVGLGVEWDGSSWIETWMLSTSGSGRALAFVEVSVT